MKNRLILLIVVLFCAFSLAAFAQEAQQRQTDPLATNLQSSYPSVDEVLPTLPAAPESMKDHKAVAEYMGAVDNYVKTAQKYIDATTNDLNTIVEQRNIAVQNANKVVDEYNNFINTNQKK